MAARLASLLVIISVGASCATGSDAARLATLTAVDGRGLQPAWWVALPSPSEPEPEPRAPDEEPTPVAPEPLTLPADALFDVGQAEVRPADIAELTAFGEALASRVGAGEETWNVIGATDTTSDEASNHELGLARAGSVIDVLVAVPGLDRTRFVAASWGETCPVADETTAADVAQARAQNRRVVLVPPGVMPPCPIPD